MCLAPAAVEMEELQEADVLWPDPDHDQHQDHCHGRRHQQLEAGKQTHGTDGGASRRREARRRAGSSAPMAIHVGTTTGPYSWAWSYDSDESAAFVPPHVVLAARRRCSEGRVAASSVCVGQGRTLKGRDLQSVRNAVLCMTGFLET